MPTVAHITLETILDHFTFRGSVLYVYKWLTPLPTWQLSPPIHRRAAAVSCTSPCWTPPTPSTARMGKFGSPQAQNRHHYHITWNDDASPPDHRAPMDRAMGNDVSDPLSNSNPDWLRKLNDSPSMTSSICHRISYCGPKGERRVHYMPRYHDRKTGCELVITPLGRG